MREFNIPGIDPKELEAARKVAVKDIKEDKKSSKPSKEKCKKK
jgi:hypothetical protein